MGGSQDFRAGVAVSVDEHGRYQVDVMRVAAAQRTPDVAGYHDLVLISGGAAALVFEAVQDRDARRVAVKVLRVDHDVAERARAWRELTTTVLLSGHPYIVEILDTGVTAEGNPFVAMELCPDGCYAGVLGRHGSVPVDEVVGVGWRVAEALQAAHDVGVVHGAVKASNILRSASGPLLSDFGIARVPVLDRTVEREESPAADLYDLAVTMRQLLVGRPTQGGPAGRGRPPAVPRTDMPEWLWFELDRALAPDPQDRHPTAYAFAEILRYHSEYAGGALPVVDDDAIEGALVSPAGGWAEPTYADAPPAGPRRPAGPRPPVGPRASAAPHPPPVTYPPDVHPRADYPPADRARGAYPGAGRPDLDHPDAGRPDLDYPDLERLAADRPPAEYAADPPPYGEPDHAFDGGSPWFDEPPRRRPWKLLAIAGAVLVALVAVASFILEPNGGDGGPGAVTPASQPAVGAPQVAVEGAPVNVKLVDEGAKITLSWTDTAGARAQFAVVGGPRGAPLTLQKVLDPASTTLTLQGLNVQQDYCYQVLAVLGVDQYARSELVCTRRS